MRRRADASIVTESYNNNSDEHCNAHAVHVSAKRNCSLRVFPSLSLSLAIRGFLDLSVEFVSQINSTPADLKENYSPTETQDVGGRLRYLPYLWEKVPYQSRTFKDYSERSITIT